jgi:membrane-associated protease RseP (regulator of RpoE activity)
MEQWAYGLFLVVLLGLFAAEVFSNYQPVKLSAFLIVAFWIPLLVLHEAGHAVVAWLLGWRVGRIVIGMGKPISRFPLGRTRVEIRIAPVEGFVTPVPLNLKRIRVKSALIYFAGPGSELLVLLVVVLLLGPATLLTRTDHLGIIACQSLCLAILVSVFINLVPHSAQTEGGHWTANDGLGIIRSFLLPDDYFRALVRSQPEGWPEAESP